MHKFTLKYKCLHIQLNNLCPPHTHTHTPESKEMKNHLLECKENDQIFKISRVKNVNKRKNRLTPVRLESEKQDKKVLASWEGSRRKFPSNNRKKPCPTYITFCGRQGWIDTPPPSHTHSRKQRIENKHSRMQGK